MQRSGTLLLVEDERILRRLVAQFLRAEGYRVVEAGDGAEALRRFEDSGPFDLALVDLNLPVLTGVEVCRGIRKANPSQPVLICSAAIIPDSESALLGLGIDHFLTKPYHPETLLEHVRAEVEGLASPPAATDRAAPLRGR